MTFTKKSARTKHIIIKLCIKILELNDKNTSNMCIIINKWAVRNTQIKTSCKFKISDIPNLLKAFKHNKKITIILNISTPFKGNTQIYQTKPYRNNKSKLVRNQLATYALNQKLPELLKKRRNKGEYMGFMCPMSPALCHPFAETLLVYT